MSYTPYFYDNVPIEHHRDFHRWITNKAENLPSSRTAIALNLILEQEKTDRLCCITADEEMDRKWDKAHLSHLEIKKGEWKFKRLKIRFLRQLNRKNKKRIKKV